MSSGRSRPPPARQSQIWGTLGAKSPDRARKVPGPHVPLDHLGLVDAGPAQPLHPQQHDLQPGRLCGIGTPDVAAAVAVEDGGGLFRPVPGQGLDGPGLDAALLAGPLGGLGHTVLLSQHIGGKLVKAVGVGGDVVLVIGALGQPDVGDGQLEGRVGVGQDGNPFIRMDGGGVIQIRADIYALDAQAGEPVAQPGGHMGHHPQGVVSASHPQNRSMSLCWAMSG